jgi:hypothetical protein
MTMTMRDERAPYMATGDAEYNAYLYGAFYMYGFSAESGYIGEKLGEPGTDDPKMQNALAHSKAIMDFVYGDDYRQVCAYKYSKESSVELWKLLGAYGDLLVSGDRDPVTGMIQMIPVGKYPLPDTELYYIQYNIKYRLSQCLNFRELFMSCMFQCNFRHEIGESTNIDHGIFMNGT